MNTNHLHTSPTAPHRPPAHGTRRRLAGQPLAGAFAEFAGRYPGWASALFDLDFLTRRAAPILASYEPRRRRATARHLAEAWAEQFGPLWQGDRRVRRVNELARVAAQFLELLDAAQFERPRTPGLVERVRAGLQRMGR